MLDGVRVQLGTFDTFAQATDAWQHAETAARRGARSGDPRAGRRPFAEVAEEYLATQQLAASTRKSYTSHVRAHLIPRSGALPIADITPAMIGAWLSEQQSAGKPLRSRVAHRATLSSVLQWAVDSGLRPNNPVHVVRGPARTPLRRRRPVLEPEQWPQLRREFHDYGPETQLLLDVAIDTGLRWGELTDLRAGHVVARTPVYVKVETVVTWPGEQFSASGDVVERKHYTKGAEDRRVDLSAAVARRLLEHIATHRLAPGDLLFDADRVRAEHAAWRARRDAEATAPWEAEWQTRLAAEPRPAGRFTKTLPGGQVRTGEHATASTYSLGCRCAHCTYANTSYNRARRRALRGDVAPRRRGPRRRGRPESREGWISPQWFGDVIWRPALQRAGLEWLHWHDLRHAHATWLLAAGVPARSVMKRLGHKNLATTEVYLGELVDVEDIASFMGAYHSIFEAALRGELWDRRPTRSAPSWPRPRTLPPRAPKRLVSSSASCRPSSSPHCSCRH